jgi:hypothetical protein
MVSDHNPRIPSPDNYLDFGIGPAYDLARLIHSFAQQRHRDAPFTAGEDFAQLTVSTGRGVRPIALFHLPAGDVEALREALAGDGAGQEARDVTVYFSDGQIRRFPNVSASFARGLEMLLGTPNIDTITSDPAGTGTGDGRA